MWALVFSVDIPYNNANWEPASTDFHGRHTVQGNSQVLPFVQMSTLALPGSSGHTLMWKGGKKHEEK